MQNAEPSTDVTLAEVVRSGFSESQHRGRLVALDRDGSVAFAFGAVGQPMLPRSSNKPMQATGMLEAGLKQSGRLLALVAASHAGEPFHIDGVRRILGDASLDETALRNAVGLPLDEQSRVAVLRAGGDASRILMNCSGKHAGMLSTCVAAGWETETYLDPEHPLQQRLRATVERLAGEPVAAVGVDGCGAPLFGISLVGLARAFRSCVTASPDCYERQVADAMRAHPEYVSGTHQLDTAVMRGLPGALAKGGAEGVQAIALPDGRALAFKITDGSKRAHGPIIATALHRLGVKDRSLAAIADAPVHGGGARVGTIRATF